MSPTTGTVTAQSRFDPTTTMMAVASVTARIEAVTDRLQDATEDVKHLRDQTDELKDEQNAQFRELRDAQARIEKKLSLLVGNNGNDAVEPVITRVLRKADNDDKRLKELERFQITAEPQVKKVPTLEEDVKSFRRLRKAVWILIMAIGTWTAQSGWTDIKPWLLKIFQPAPTMQTYK